VVIKIEKFINSDTSYTTMKRVLIKDLAGFLKDINKEKSLKKFSKKTKINYNNLKRWARGESLIPEKEFLNLLSYSKNKSHWLKNIEYKEEYWGSIKGGINSSKKRTKKEIREKMEKMRSCIKRKPKKVIFKMNKRTCEFYGSLMGDGCITKHKIKGRKHHRHVICFVGHRELEKEYHEIYLRNLIKEEFKLNPYIWVSKKKKARVLKIHNKSLFSELIKLKFPLGKKGQKLKIPKKIENLPWNLQKYVIRGLFDTDGSIYARKDEFYRHPHLSITSISRPLIKQLHKILRKRGYPAWINKYPLKFAQAIVIKGNKNTIKWMRDIGSSNSKHIFKYQYWLKNKKLPTYLLG
jgi:hypothetical protein|tara:strand:+ start:15719 stop:16771 length:1053 start_codon:yes stop_codon:yes gene_type:complete